MERRPKRPDYLRENSPLIESLVDGFEEALRRNPYRSLLYRHCSQPSFHLVEGELTVESFAGTLIPADSPSPIERAAELNRALIAYADNSLLHLPDLVKDLMPDTYLTGFTYEHALWRQRIFDHEDDQEIVSALDVYADSTDKTALITLYQVDCGIEQLSSHLLILAHHDNPLLIYSWAQSEADKAFDMCEGMFGEHSRAMELLNGHFESEAELDSNLATIRAATRGIYPEAEIDAVLAIVREQALASLGDEVPVRCQRRGGTPTVGTLRQFLNVFNSFGEGR